MRKLFSIGILIFFISNVLVAQSGKLTGKVINANSGQPLASATITLLEKSRTTISDQNGGFSFSSLEPGVYSIKCSYIGYTEKIVEEIIIQKDANTSISVSINEKSSIQNEVVLVSRTRAKSETVASLLVAQKNSASVSDGISAESIRKTPDRSTSDVLKRVSGASIQDDRFAIIRGLNDRYNAAFINGAPLPSTESDRKAFAFDIFPAAILDNLIIYKTATADKSAEFAGGLIEITTKSIPSKSFTSVTIGGSYNSLITGNDRYYSQNKGGKDWIGIDDGTRGIPAGIPSVKDVKQLLNFAERADLAKLFGNYKWGVNKHNTAPNFNFQLAKGFNIERKKQEFFGALFSLNYNRNFSFSEGDRNSYQYDIVEPPPDSAVIQNNKFKDSLYNDEIVVAALGNISVKLNNRNSFSWKNNLSINTDNRIVKRMGTPDFTADQSTFIKETVRWFTSNQIFSSQLSGEHLVGPIKTKINWIAAYSKVQRDIPNLSRTSYVGTYPDISSLYSNFSSGPPSQTSGSGSMFFTNSDENIKSFKADITQPYKFMRGSQNLFKLGAGYQVRSREFTSRVLGFAPYNDNDVTFDYSLFLLPESEIFLPEHLGKMANGKGGFLLSDGTLGYSNYTASSALTSLYAMNDQRFFKKLRLIYGIRMERFNQKLQSVKNLNDSIYTNTVIADFLPSVNIVYALTPKMNIRLSYAQTINRPEFRELAPFLFYDFVSNYTYEGQEILQRVKIKNYDFRYEFFPGKAQLFSLSAFYKEFANPIEIIAIPNLSNQTLYVNATLGKVYGFEAEFRTLVSTLFGITNENSLLGKFTLSANAAYIKSSVKLDSLFSFDPKQLVTDRSLQGQSPYLINGSIGFNDEETGFSSTLSVNRVGDRIAIAGTYNTANIYEKARTVIDFQLAKFFLKNKLEVKITARDILAQNVAFYFDFDKTKTYTSKDRFFSSNTAPRVFSVNATYKF